MHTRYRLLHLSIVGAPLRAVAYNIAKTQSSKIYVALLPVQNFFGMEVWNEIWKKILVWNEIWNGRFLVWNGNGMEENCQHGIWKNRLPLHSIPRHAGQYRARIPLYMRRVYFSVHQGCRLH